MPMTRAHFSDSYLLDPRHPVTVNVIGAGGNRLAGRHLARPYGYGLTETRPSGSFRPGL